MISDNNQYIKIRAENSKSAKERLIPVNKTLLDLLKQHIANVQENEPIFKHQNHKHGFNNAVAKMVNEHNIKHFRFHDLRHTFASTLAKNGASLPVIKALLGHSTIRMTERYAHSNEEELMRAVKSLETNNNDNGNTTQENSPSEYPSNDDDNNNKTGC